MWVLWIEQDENLGQGLVNEHPRRIQSHHSVTFDKNTFLNLPSKCSKKSLWKRNMYNIQRQNRETTNILPNQMHRHWADTISSFCLIHKLELREYNSCTAARADTQHAVALQANESWTISSSWIRIRREAKQNDSLLACRLKFVGQGSSLFAAFSRLTLVHLGPE